MRSAIPPGRFKIGASREPGVYFCTAALPAPDQHHAADQRAEEQRHPPPWDQTVLRRMRSRRIVTARHSRRDRAYVCPAIRDGSGASAPPRQISRVGCLCRAAFLRLARQVARDEQVLHTAIDLDRDIGTRLNSNGGNVGVSLDAFPHRGGGFRAVTTGPCAPTDYLSSLALDSGAACGADRITTQRGRCARCFSQTATREANVV